MLFQSIASGAAVLTLTFEEAVTIMRMTGTSLFNAGTLSQGDLAQQELRIANLNALQATVQRFWAKVPVNSLQLSVEMEFAIRTIRRSICERRERGMATLRDVADVEMKLTKFVTLAALGYQLSELQGIPFVAAEDGFEKVQADLLATVHARFAVGEATEADIAETVLKIAEAGFLRQVAYGH